MTDLTDRLKSRIERARGRGQTATFFEVEDIAYLMSENEGLKAENYELQEHVEELKDAAFLSVALKGRL